MDDVDAVVVMENVATSAHGADAAGTEGTDSLHHVDTTVPEAEVEDVTAGTLFVKSTIPPRGTITDGEHTAPDAAQSADAVGAGGAELADSRCMEIDDHEDSVDQSVAGADCASNSACLEAMTPSGQDHYLRLGDSPRRRSALRLSRIIARQQLLRKLLQGRKREVVIMSIGYRWVFLCR